MQASPDRAAPSIAWRWDALDQAQWTALLGRATLPTLEQCWAYGAAIESVSPYRAHRGVAWQDGRPVALVQLFARRVGPVTIAKILRGPLALEPLDPPAALAMLRPIAASWRIRRLRPLFWLPEPPADAPAMRLLGKRPMVVGNATARLDLDADEQVLRDRLDGKWRNQLTRAERSALRVQTDHGGRMMEWLAAQHEAFRRAGRHRGPSDRELRALVGAMRPREDALVLTAFDRARPVAGILVAVHGRGATYHVAWTGDEGRRLCAHNLLLWHAVLALRRRGVAFLDLGGLDARAPGVARFKLGLGARVVPLAATYL